MRGIRLVPEPPSFWEENGQLYMGFDYRNEKGVGYQFETGDYAGIRPVYFVNGWPTMWTPLEMSFSADCFPDAIGENLSIQFRNTGTAGSILGVDHITIQQD